MLTLAKRVAVIAVGYGAILVSDRPLAAQVVVAPSPQRLFPVNPNPYIAPGVKLQQYAYNTAVLGRAYSRIPPYLLGYNPYPTGVNYGPVYNPQLYQPQGYNYMQPMYGMPGNMPYSPAGYQPYYGANPYQGGYTSATGDPSSSYGGGYNPYYWNPYSGGYNYGTSSELQAYAQLGLSQEQARILREKAEQAKLDTRKKLVDTLAYIRANEYTFSQQQADIAKRIHERMMKAPTPQEVASGKSLNVLAEELGKGKFTSNQLRGQTITLDEDILRMVNVAGAGSQGPVGSIGLLRDNGRFAWPSVFDEKFFDPKLKKDVEVQAQELFQQSLNAKVDKNALKDLKANLRTLRETLSKNSTQVLTQNYLEGIRFLHVKLVEYKTAGGTPIAICS